MPTHLDRALADFVDRRALVSATWAVVARDGRVELGAHGVRDLVSGAPTPRDAIMRLHSMTKPITAVALLALVDRGACALDTELGAILPELADLRVHDRPGDVPPIRLEHLLTHTAGLPYPVPNGTPAERAMADAIGTSPDDGNTTLARYTERIGRATLAHPPGEGFTYGVATDLLGRVIEVLTGSTLDVAIETLVTGPLRMADTTFRPTGGALDRVAPIHRRTRDGRFEVLDADVGRAALLSGGGGLYATAADYARFCAMLLRDGELDGVRVLRADTARSLSRCQLGDLVDRPDIRANRHLGAGLGFSYVGRVVRDPRVAELGDEGAFGWDGVCGNTFVVDLRAGFAAVLLTQILPWPDGLHRAFRAAARADARSEAGPNT